MSDILPTEEARVAEARNRLSGSLGELQARLAPKALAQTAVQGLVDKGQAAAQSGIDTARKHPAALAGIVATLGLFVARRPIARLFSSGHATSAPPKSSKSHTRVARRNAE